MQTPNTFPSPVSGEGKGEGNIPGNPPSKEGEDEITT